MNDGRFQCGIAAVVYHTETQTYLLLKRSSKHEVGQEAWECVTGRVNQGESFEVALHREVLEELSVMIQLDFIIGTSHFYRGQAQPENELLGVKYACTVAKREAICISAEHSEFRWLTANDVYNLLSANHWLAQTIRRAEIIRHALPTHLVEFFRAAGFETN